MKKEMNYFKRVLFLIIFLFVVLTIFQNNLILAQDPPENLSRTNSNSSGIFKIFEPIRNNLGNIKNSVVNLFNKGLDFGGWALGFDEGAYEFFFDVLMGLLAGLWIYLIYVLASWERLFVRFSLFKANYSSYSTNLKASWLGFIGSQPWKILVVAVFYAVIMQIPILNRFIQIITFEFLLDLKVVLTDGIIVTFFQNIFTFFIKSFILAFYIGLLPTAIQEFSRYKLRKKYYDYVLEQEALGRAERARMRGSM